MNACRVSLEATPHSKEFNQPTIKTLLLSIHALSIQLEDLEGVKLQKQAVKLRRWTVQDATRAGARMISPRLWTGLL
jgi:hypothetical protein